MDSAAERSLGSEPGSAAAESDPSEMPARKTNSPKNSSLLTLQQAEKTLQSRPMLRIRCSCLINMNQVREISRTPRGEFILVLGGSTTVTSREGFREAVREHLERLKVRAG